MQECEEDPHNTIQEERKKGGRNKNRIKKNRSMSMSPVSGALGAGFGCGCLSSVRAG